MQTSRQVVSSTLIFSFSSFSPKFSWQGSGVSLFLKTFGARSTSSRLLRFWITNYPTDHCLNSLAAVLSFIAFLLRQETHRQWIYVFWIPLYIFVHALPRYLMESIQMPAGLDLQVQRSHSLEIFWLPDNTARLNPSPFAKLQDLYNF